MIKRRTWTVAVGLATLGASHAAASDLAQADAQPAATAVATVPESIEPVAVASSGASLAVQDAETGDDGWNVSFTPYVWIAGAKGDIGIPRGQNEVEIDKSFTDTLSNLNFAFMGTLDVERNRFVAVADVIYLSLGADIEGSRDPQFFEGEVDSKTFVSTLAVGYRVVDQGPLFVDLLAGARIVSLDVELEVRGPLTTRRADASKTSVAPLIGGRVRVPVSKNISLGAYGDFGFKSSGVKWQLLGTVQWDISRHWGLIGGYRHMALKYNKNDLDFDVGLSGPIIGLRYSF